MNIWAVLLAAGKSSRLQNQGQVQKKQFLKYHGLPLFWHSVQTFARNPQIKGLVAAFPAKDLQQSQSEVRDLQKKRDPGIALVCVGGGALRQNSVFNAMQALPPECTHVLVHDAARPFFSPRLITSLIREFSPGLGGVIPGIECKDTIKELDGDQVLKTLPRDRLTAVQTPQFFSMQALRDAHQQALKQDFTATDDASMLEECGYRVKVIPGEEKNIKITTSEDLQVLASQEKSALPCTGLGYDVHRYGGDRPMILGGQPIPGAPGIHAHSDGDVLVHALVDAILGCLGKGDIGDLFPDTDPANENLSSMVFLSEVLAMAQAEKLELVHIDITIIAQKPKLGPHKSSIRSNLAGITGIDPGRINIKATTEEGLGFTGSGQGIKAMALVSALRHKQESAH
ncbi:2-C-methyl-D-erythritol 4-phosphate cytidylyltransferase [Desulfonatronospira thiodismutans ASO3-1]|uniref:Bifunctional enzyme IspD/IspF n=1 Tax=Desulfonatronospira thiodismutans ASO3-1 TaxID=555779 RepID=D6SMF1_9BACT|nr:2-C-methyl-D-erythritol 4-phosphate cytidylyltransferase [Desulfonatronospira thiodismutans]EFI35862.1 2-C-methyl-D-erythritol 4-phosphate cytidylyltransferase [Desulfonatronospira thiodismutans ASO3-1]